MKKIPALLLSLLSLFLLCACGASSTTNDVSAEMSKSDASTPVANGGGILAGSEEDQFFIMSPESVLASDPDAKIIRTAELTIQTLDFDQSVTALAALTETYGGYYETAQVNSGSYYDQHARRSAYYVVRIPKENFTHFRDDVGTVGHLHNYTENAQNIGEEYYDTEARLETLTTKRERLLLLLDQADVMEDIISLEDALADVQYEIDLHTSTLRKYDSLIDYSTFTIDLDEVAKIEQEAGLQDSYGARLLANLKTGLSNFGDGLQDLSLWLARNLISLVILAAAVAAAVLIVLRRRKKRRSNHSVPNE